MAASSRSISTGLRHGIRRPPQKTASTAWQEPTQLSQTNIDVPAKQRKQPVNEHPTKVLSSAKEYERSDHTRPEPTQDTIGH
jgi:hypothetical protein